MSMVDLTQVYKLAADLAAAGVAGKLEAKAIVAKAGSEVERAAEADAPVLTGQLVRGIYRRVEGDDVIVGSDDRQGFYQQFGTSRHGPQPWLFHNGERGGDLIAKLLVEIDPL